MAYKIVVALMLIAVALTLRNPKNQRVDKNEGCDYAFATHTYPNPSFYY